MKDPMGVFCPARHCTCFFRKMLGRHPSMLNVPSDAQTTQQRTTQSFRFMDRTEIIKEEYSLKIVIY